MTSTPDNSSTRGDALYAFPKGIGSGEDPLVELIKVANKRYPGFITRVVDGGAGVGSFTDRVITGSSECNVTAYEPLPENAKVLRSRFSSARSVEIREVALGDRLGTVRFEVPERQGIPASFWQPGTSYAGYVSKHRVLAAMKRLAKWVLRRGNNAPIDVITVKMVRLDSELKSPPDLIKMDLQGGEPEALDGLGELLSQVKVVKIEVLLLGAMKGYDEARSKCVRKLKEAGFSFYVEDFQFSVPEVTPKLRKAFADHGMEIEVERRLHPSHGEVMIKGSWPSDRPLPIQNQRVMGHLRAIELADQFRSVLLDAKTSYFCVDLIALNGRFAKEWSSLLPSKPV